MGTFRRVGKVCYSISTKIYHISYKKNLFLTNALIGGSIAATGDTVVQKVIEKRKNVDLRRLAAMASWGVVYGIIGHFYFSTMSRSITFGSSPHKQALVYLVCFVPIYDTMFYVYTGFFEGQSKNEVKEELSAKLIPTLLIDAFTYYPLMYLNIRFVPLPFRVTVDNFYGFLYGVCFSYLKHHEIDIPALRINLDQKIAVEEIAYPVVLNIQAQLDVEDIA